MYFPETDGKPSSVEDLTFVAEAHTPEAANNLAALQLAHFMDSRSCKA